jgi:DNA-binding beta-propeller fold protein YncE
MQGIKRNVEKLVVVILTVVAVSCAKVPVDKLPELYWPLPPQKPRVKFVDLIMGSMDVTGARTGKFKSLIFGEAIDFRLSKPSFVAVNDNIIFVTDVGMVQMYDFNNKKFGLIGRRLLITATGIDVTSDGTLYVGDSSKRKVYIFERGAEKIRSLGELGDFIAPGGIAVDENKGRVLVADAKKHTVIVFSLEGEKLLEFGKRGERPGEFNFPYDVAVDPEGRIYVLDAGNFRVQIFDPDGNFIRQFGAVGTAPGHFSRPKSISLDSEGHIYVVDAGFSNYQIFDDKGNVFLAVGTGGLDPGMFKLPFGIDIDENDKIYVVDQLNHRIQIFQYLK